MNHIITSTNKEYIPFLIEFLISLKELGKFQGKTWVLYYYKEEKEINNIKHILSKFDVELRFSKTELDIRNIFYIDVIEILESLDDRDGVALYDCDIWFQDDINDLFDLDGDKLHCSIEIVEGFPRKETTKRNLDYKNNTERLFGRKIKEYEDGVENIVLEYGNHLNTGLVYANKKTLRNRLVQLRMLLIKADLSLTGPDQFLMHTVFDIKEDVCNNLNIYNYCLAKENAENLRLEKPLILNGRIIKALHYNQKAKPIGVDSFHEFRFFNFYPEIVEKYI